MARFIKDRIKAKGQVPGALIFLGNQKMEAPVIQFMQYNSDCLTEEHVDSIETAFSKIRSKDVNWINIYGIHDLDMMGSIGKTLNLPSLLLEDILNTDTRPKYIDGEDFDAFILKMLHHDLKTKMLHAEQISFILGENYILTLQERKGDVFAPVRDRIRTSRGRIRFKENDYLAYVLMDTIADNYTILIEELGGKVEDLEDKIFLKEDTKIVEDIYKYKIELNFLRKSIRPVKDLMTQLIKSETSYFHELNKKYITNLNDLIIHSTDAIELYNNLISDQLNIYNANVGNRMNGVMKILTIFASIFIPLTFIAGIYGMNFEYLPELKYKYAYPVFWVAVLSIVVVLLLYFRRKKWL